MAGRLFRYPLRRIFWPPSLVWRQAGSLGCYAHAAGWSRAWRWLGRHGIKTLPIAAGAVGMGCIGYPAHPAWEVTGRCNLRCIHCHANQNSGASDLSTDEAKRLIDGIRAVDEFRMLVYTGGEPLVREDLPELLEYSYRRGFINVIATNGTLITDEMARDLKRCGVAEIAVSLDGSCPHVHDRIRSDHAFDRALRGIEAVQRAGIMLQINTTAMQYNFDDLENIIDLADANRATIILMYQLVGVGRASAIGEATLDRDLNEQLLARLAAKQKKVTVMVEPVAGPQFWPYLLEQAGLTSDRWRRKAERFFHGCAAGRGFVYIKANGEVWPCPFIEINAGDVRQTPFPDIWRQAEVFRLLRNRESLLQGRCHGCRWQKICGGCRGRALAETGNLMAADSSCFID